MIPVCADDDRLPMPGDPVPTIIVHGLGQMTLNVEMPDATVNFALWSLGVPDLSSVLPKLIWRAFLSLLLQHDIGLSEALIEDVLRPMFAPITRNADGSSVYPQTVEKYNDSMADSPESVQNTVYGRVRIRDFAPAEFAAYTYYYAFNSFGSQQENVIGLYDFCKDIQVRTGAEKINLVGLSQGGAVITGFLDAYPGYAAAVLQKLLFVIPALDGSKLLTSIFAGDFNYDGLYSEIIPSLMPNNWMGYALNLVLRILSRNFVKELLDGALEFLVGECLGRSSAMWALLPSGDVPTLAERWLTDPASAPLRAEVEAHVRAQQALSGHLADLQSAGVEIYNVAEYDRPLYAFVNDFEETNSDTIIHLTSASPGVTCTAPGQVLPVQPNASVCTDVLHNHRSPSGTVNAATAQLCETTWYISNADHESTPRNNTVVRLVCRLLLDDSITDVHSSPDCPQFIETPPKETAVLSWMDKLIYDCFKALSDFWDWVD
jgi:hypothetical protein